MKFETTLARVALRLFGISWKDLDEIFRDIMSFVCTPIMLGFGFNRIAPTSSHEKPQPP